MSKSRAHAGDYLKLVYKGTAIADLAENDTTSPATDVFVAMHSADPGETGTQATSELSYTGYARKAVARGAGFTVTNDRCVNAADIVFDPCTSGSGTAKFWSTGLGASGATAILHSGPLGTAVGPFVADTDDTITAKAHGLAVSDQVVFTEPPNATLPTGITEGTVYFVKTVPDADTITIAATDGGTTINLTADGDGDLWKIAALAISAGITPQIDAGAMVIDEE